MTRAVRGVAGSSGTRALRTEAGGGVARRDRSRHGRRRGAVARPARLHRSDAPALGAGAPRRRGNDRADRRTLRAARRRGRGEPRRRDRVRGRRAARVVRRPGGGRGDGDRAARSGRRCGTRVDVDRIGAPFGAYRARGGAGRLLPHRVAAARDRDRGTGGESRARPGARGAQRTGRRRAGCRSCGGEHATSGGGARSRCRRVRRARTAGVVAGRRRCRRTPRARGRFRRALGSRSRAGDGWNVGGRGGAPTSCRCRRARDRRLRPALDQHRRAAGWRQAHDRRGTSRGRRRR